MANLVFEERGDYGILLWMTYTIFTLIYDADGNYLIN